MFKVPNNSRLEEIADMIPEWISVMSQEGNGYNVRISKLGEVMRAMDIARELGISIGKPDNIAFSYLIKVVEENQIPEFAVVVSKLGRYRISFESSEDSAVIIATRNYGDYCIDGRMFVVSDIGISMQEIKRMMASGLESCYHINDKKAYAF